MDTSSIVEIFRTQEGENGYKTAITIVYFYDWAFLHGFSSEPTMECVRELKEYLRTKNVSEVFIMKRGRDGSFRKVKFKLRNKNHE